MKKLTNILCAILVVALLMTTFIANANEPQNTLTIISAPNKTEYIYEYDGKFTTCFDKETGENINYFQYDFLFDGLQIGVNLDNGEYVELAFDDCNYYKVNIGEIIAFYDFGQMVITYDKQLKLGLNNMTVSFGNTKSIFNVNIKQNPIKTFEVKNLPNKTKYYNSYDSVKSSYYDNSGNLVEYDSYRFNPEGMLLLINGETQVDVGSLGGCNYFVKNGMEYAVYEYLNQKIIIRHSINLNYGANEYIVEYLGKEAKFNLDFAKEKSADFNNDGFVNANDYTLLMSHMGEVSNAINEFFDLSCDGYINAVDYSIFAQKMGSKQEVLL